MANRWPACLSSQTGDGDEARISGGRSQPGSELSRATGTSTEYEYIGSAYWNEQKATGIRIVEELKTKVKTKGNGATLGQVRAQKTNTETTGCPLR